MTRNCGLDALSKIRELKGASAFTLIHLGKDNGVDLKLFKVKESDLPLVHRPAIFHSENHFEYIANGEPLPDRKWTGFVLTEKSIGRPISHKEAKTIKGEMPPVAAVVGAIISAVSTAASITASVVGAIGTAAGSLASGMGIGATGALTQTGAAISGMVQGGIYGAGAGAALAGATGQPIGKGALYGAGAGAGAGFGGAYGGIAGASGAQVGGTLAGAGTGALLAPEGQRLSGAVKGGAGGYLAGTFADASKSYFADKAAGSTGIAAATKAGEIGTKAASSGLLGSGGIGSTLATGALTMGAKALGPQGPDSITFDAAKEYANLRNVLGTQGMPPAVESQILKDINTPLNEMAKNFAPVSDRTLRQINKAFDQQTQNMQRQFAQAGQNMRNSSEFRNEMQKIEQQRAVVLGEAEQEAFNTGMTQAVQSKQFALNTSIQNEQFDIGIAFELADAIGQREMFNAAIEQNDEQQFNELLSSMLSFNSVSNEYKTLLQQSTS